MNKVLNFFKSVGDKWKNLSKSKKISLIIILTGLIISCVIFAIYSNRVEYDVLFSNLEPQDSSKVIEKLKNDKIQYKIEGNSILVPKEKVEELRLSIFSDTTLPSNLKGFELFDQNKFGVTDTEAKIMYQRALEGELARTIQGFDEVEKARVHLVLPEDSVFTRDEEKARASVTLKLKGNSKLSPEQVKAIISLISASVKNLPKENVEIIDNNMNLLSENIFENEQNGIITSTKQQEFKNQFEKNLQSDVKNMLEKVFGKDKVTVKINADLDFDSRQISTIKYDKDSIIRSQHKIKENSNDSNSQGAAGSPINNNMSNTFQNNNQSSVSNREEEITNYEIGQTEEKIIKAPGEIKRLTVSVVIDGNLSELEKQSIRNIVSAATGLSEERGDVINIEALAFNDEYKKKAQADLEEMKKQEELAKKRKTYIMIGEAVAGLIVLLVIALIYKKKNKKNVEQIEQNQIDMLIGDVIQKQPIAYEPVLEDIEQEMNLEKEIKNYASTKPEQVVELVKTWLAEDER
ncbi:flagellar basal-body MS-ring/collar protein FliF [Caloramator proteoclasticus]|uniref:Flagellar M-ring protein n=1 Tax=Caloramator proteoclasticus DSM 10124 TaxID=1121262 RepID=A0A1M4SU71_9CLOT|nr:flagellar basal-body MS-ring/collar protein FliF [Caloramator proteoclasticus]SHE35741.1 flagellar M-ring protein FliF [Caloramator proteoclasticus DSM 10124]